ncbi:MAG: hypothetical protein V7L05_26350 [Nostoc sp.]|uniref:hypothetical protein n=1 Tax=Nostoc sp. TaxID=1180 RepID=UPI002FF8FEEF
MSEPRYGIWALVGGNFGPLDTQEEPVDASYERSRSLILEAERLGINEIIETGDRVEKRSPVSRYCVYLRLTSQNLNES